MISGATAATGSRAPAKTIYCKTMGSASVTCCATIEAPELADGGGEAAMRDPAAAVIVESRPVLRTPSVATTRQS